MIEGPRAVREQEFDSLIQLVNRVFRSEGGNMQTEYPQLFNAENLGNLLVMVDDGRVISHIGLLFRDVTIYGCRLTVGCIGAVATDEEYRGRGLASKLLFDAFARIEEVGGSLILISGGRGLYRRNACVPVLRSMYFEISRSFADKNADSELTLKSFDSSEIATVSALYRREPVRFLRPVEDYRYFLDSGVVMSHPSDLWLIKRGSRVVAYVVVQKGGTASTAPQIVEYAGDRRAIVQSLAMLIDHSGGTDSLNLFVPVADEPFCWQLQDLDLTGVKQEGWTVRIQNFEQFLQSMRPYFAEILGTSLAQSVTVEDSDSDITFFVGKEQLTLSRDDATALVFGTADNRERQILEEHKGTIAETLGELFPIPAPWYGLNYV